jgi:uncharacterized membrane protein YfcA
MLIRTLYVEPASVIAAVVCSLIVAGLLKEVIGVGMPVVALPLLSLFIDIKAAAMLLSMPLILSNLPQALEGGKTGRCLMQLLPVLLGMIPGLFLGVRVLLALDANVAKMIAGLVVMGAGGVTLLAPQLQLARSRHRRDASQDSAEKSGCDAGWQDQAGRLFSYSCWRRGCADRRSQRRHRCISWFPPACWPFS